MKVKKILAGLILLALVAVPAAVLADGIITITSGVMTVTTSDVNFGSFSFSLTEFDVLGAFPVSKWWVRDETGDQVAWDGILTVGDFIDGGDTIPVDGSNLAVTVNIADTVCNEGDCTDPLPVGVTASYLTAGVPLAIIESDPVSTHLPGGWAFRPYFDLTVPAATLTGVFTSVWTFDAIASP